MRCTFRSFGRTLCLQTHNVPEQCYLFRDGSFDLKSAVPPALRNPPAGPPLKTLNACHVPCLLTAPRSLTAIQFTQSAPECSLASLPTRALSVGDAVFPVASLMQSLLHCIFHIAIDSNTIYSPWQEKDCEISNFPVFTLRLAALSAQSSSRAGTSGRPLQMQI